MSIIHPSEGWMLVTVVERGNQTDSASGEEMQRRENRSQQSGVKETDRESRVKAEQSQQEREWRELAALGAMEGLGVADAQCLEGAITGEP